MLERSRLIVCGVALLGLGPLGLTGCGGQEFKSNGASGGASSTAGSETGAQSAGGSSSAAGSASAGDASGGASDNGGSGSSGGTASAVCECPAGQYCRDGSVDCFDCAELNRLHFAVPERMSTLSDNGQGSHFPRVGTTSTDLVYRFDGVGMRYTSDASTSAGSSVKGTIPQDTGPLLLDQNVEGGAIMGLPSFNFVFDRVEEMTRRSLYFGVWSGGGLQMFERAPSPYNGDASDYSAAVAVRPTADGLARLYWMTDRGASTGMPVTLVTALLEATAPGAPVPLKLGQNTCSASDPDYTPWVTADGKTLLISHTRVDANCKATGQGKDIYTALLQPATGMPTAAAVPMNDVNSPMNDVEPSFSADLCDLYFASDRDGKYALYRAHRR
jgi:hypothetical protein